jgi:hypothetical protein
LFIKHRIRSRSTRESSGRRLFLTAPQTPS